MLQQFSLFAHDGVEFEIDSEPTIRRRRNFGPPPTQRDFRLKLARKIAFKKRFKETPGEGNDLSWEISGIERLHWELFLDWEERFPFTTNIKDQMDFWVWMLGDEDQAFSFHDVLIIAGYRDPESVILGLQKRTPDWLVELQELPCGRQAKYLKSLLKDERGKTTSARQLAVSA